MTRRFIIRPEIVANQRRASNPATSAWVRANAGSGKTYVLTQRVLRLLLAGVRPEEILCLTYTKAAAAEMRGRVSKSLAEWALLDDVELAARLETLEHRPPIAALLARARTLFARALETPGGLRINTIHAFCESVLHRFPLEAGVPFDFTVIEESDARDLVRRAREAVLAEGLRGGSSMNEAVETLFGLLSDFSITEAIDMALQQGRTLRYVLADRAGAKARLRLLVGARPGETRAGILQRVVDESLFPLSRYDELFLHAPPDLTKAKSLNFSERLWRLRNNPPDGEKLFEAFLKDGEPYKDRCTTRIRDAALAEIIGAEHDRLAALYPSYRRTLLLARSEALLDVLGAIADRYEAGKRARSLLDFDDLVEKLGALFADEGRAAWVKYKLDAGLTHVLVDESQDTNPEQWRVVDALVTEFFVGDSGAGRLRTVFAVGDEKQSIYSFQGADPALFEASGRRYAAAARAVGLVVEMVPLHTSFRTLPGILAAVDLVFDEGKLREAVRAFDAPVHHETARAEAGGTVTLWPPIREEGEDVDPHNWPLEASDALKSAPRRLAERIAGSIRFWIDDRRPLGPRGRAVTPGDILILVQTRSVLFYEILRALAKEGLPSPGADRLAVTTHIAVLDLLALGDVLLNSGDDLQLAALLRSPLFDVSEDDLFAIAANRRGSLWRALEASDRPTAREAFARLHRWRARLDFERPFEFFAAVLYRDGGLRRFHARLGGEVDDLMAEFLELALAHEQTPQPSLQGFLAATRAREVSIRRELAEAAGIRVMTVHGAKGLEAPIVILADAAGSPRGPQKPKTVFLLRESPGPLLVHASGVRGHVPETLPLRTAAEAADNAEYWRRLYVGMTRAEDELYVTGVLTKTAKLDGTWYEAVEAALGPHAESVTDADGAVVAITYPHDSVAPAPLAAAPPDTLPPPAVATLAPLPQPVLRPIIRPSSAFEAAAPDRVYDTTAETVAGAEAARRGGIALHALLQHLGRVPEADRAAVVAAAMPVLLPDDPDLHAGLGTRARAILANPALAELFGPDSRAEVPFLLDARRDGEDVRLAGRLDRIVVAPGRVMVVDYKSDANPPRFADDVPLGYVTQLGLYALVAGQLYPGSDVQAAILWTTLESLMILPPQQLRDAVSNFTMR